MTWVLLDMLFSNFPRFPSRAKSILITSYLSAIRAWPQVIDWLREGGHRVPDDIGFLNLDWAPEHPSIAGVDQRHELIGEAAVDAVVAQLHRNERGVPSYAKTILVDGEWAEGTTIRSAQTGS